MLKEKIQKIENINYDNMNMIYMYPEFTYDKLMRNLNNRFVEDDSNILEVKKKNNPLLDVNELMNYNTKLTYDELDIYNLNDCKSNNKLYVKNLGFW